MTFHKKWSPSKKVNDLASVFLQSVLLFQIALELRKIALELRKIALELRKIALELRSVFLTVCAWCP